jgi:D-aminopeptidase
MWQSCRAAKLQSDLATLQLCNFFGETMPRIRDLNVYNGRLSPGPVNAITDVTGVAVGHYTLIDEKVPGQAAALSALASP